MISFAPTIIELAYFISALCFIIGLRRMSTPSKARSGIWVAGIGMFLAIGATFLHPDVIGRFSLVLVAMCIGVLIALIPARRVPLTKMPQMIALYNGLGGGAAAGIAAVELLRVTQHGPSIKLLAFTGALIGSIAFSGSILAWARLSGRVVNPHRFANRQIVYVSMLAAVLMLGFVLIFSTTAHPILLLLFFICSLVFGSVMTLPIAAADLPVLISLYNALAGLAVALEGVVFNNPAMIVAGTLVFAAGALLTRLMARSVNRRLSEIMYSGFGLSHVEQESRTAKSPVNEVEAFDAAVSMAYAENVVIVPGYGMAIAQAQHKVQELTQLLEERGVNVRFAIHPVAGRMPGHMNVLLAEAGVSYEKIVDLSEINGDFNKVDVALVIGASDIVNLAARSDERSPLHGMPILNVDEAGSVIVLKRGDGVGYGYAGVENPLLQHSKTKVLHGDAKASVQDLIGAVKSLD